MAQINQLGGNGTVLLNASTNIREDTWYKVVAKISENETTAELYDINGTLLEKIATINDAMNASELVILIADNIDKAVVFKDLKVETLNNIVQPPANLEGDKKAANGSELLAPYVNLAILLVAIFAAVVYVTRRRHVRDKTRENTR